MLEKLKILIQEEAYGLFTDEELEEYLKEITVDNKVPLAELYKLAGRLALLKSGMPEVRLGDISIKPPMQFFQHLASEYEQRYRELAQEEGSKGDFRVVKRYDQR